MDEVKAVERMRLVLDAAIHMRAPHLAGISLDRRRAIDDLQLVAVFEHRHIFARHNGDHREGRAVGLPAFGAAAGVIVGDVALDADLDRPVLAFADQGAAAKAARAFLYAVVNRWVDMNGHGSILLVFDVFDSEYDDRTDRLAFVHQIEALVDFLELEDMGDHRIDLNLSVHVPVNDLRHVGAAPRPAEGGSFPDAAGHKLERPGCDFLAGFRDADDDGDAPAAMTAFQRLSHHGGIAGAVERVVG